MVDTRRPAFLSQIWRLVADYSQGTQKKPSAGFGSGNGSASEKRYSLEQILLHFMESGYFLSKYDWRKAMSKAVRVKQKLELSKPGCPITTNWKVLF